MDEYGPREVHGGIVGFGAREGAICKLVVPCNERLNCISE